MEKVQFWSLLEPGIILLTAELVQSLVSVPDEELKPMRAFQLFDEILHGGTAPGVVPIDDCKAFLMRVSSQLRNGFRQPDTGYFAVCHVLLADATKLFRWLWHISCRTERIH